MAVSILPTKLYIPLPRPNLVIRTHLLDRLGDRPSALDMLSRALRGAAKEGYVHAFLVEDVRVSSLRPAVRDVDPTFVDRLLEAVPDGSPVSLPQPLLEPLTVRELQVLRLVSLGHSNAEIAVTLVIALGTVKRHTNHIYGKLQVYRRTEAVARARELGLL